MQSPIRIVLLWIFIAVSAFTSGYYTSVTKHKFTQSNSSLNRNLAVDQFQDLRFLNPLIDCMNGKNLRMDELKTFHHKIDNYIDQCSYQNKSIRISYYFRDLNTGMVIGTGEKELFSPASLMKVPCLIAVLKLAEDDPNILNKLLRYSVKDFSGIEEEAGFAKKDGAYYSVEDLLKQCIEFSDNAATDMLIGLVGFKNITKVEDDLNLHIESYYNSYTNFVSVRSYAAIFRILYNCSYLNEIMSEKALELLLNTRYENGIRAGIPPEIKVAHKYGIRDDVSFDGKRNCLQVHQFGIVYYPQKSYIIGVMVKGNNSKEEKEKIIEELSRITFDEVDHQIRNSKNNNHFNRLINL